MSKFRSTVASNSQKPRALVVDDSTTCRLVVSNRLEACDVDVDHASEGVTALEKIFSTSYDLVVLDLEMPGLSGIQLLQRIRADSRVRHMPVVVLTSDETRDGVDQALAAGATSYFTKPLNWSTFAPHITNLIQLVRSSRIALENMGCGLAMFDPDGAIALCNTDYCDLLDIEPDQKTLYWNDVCASVSQHDASCPPPVKPGSSLNVRQVNWDRVVEFDDGRILDFSYQPLANGGWTEVVKDITLARRNAQRMEYLAKRDRLTGILNRGEFVELLETKVYLQSKFDKVVLFIIDVDDFKSINDTRGHLVGDAVLRTVAKKLGSCARENDIVGRIGGDEFAVLLSTNCDDSEIQAIAERLRAECAKPISLSDGSVSATVSIGYCIAKSRIADSDELLRNADLALYDAKRGGRNEARPYYAALDEAHRKRLKLEAGLRSVTITRELELHYQPIVHSHDRSVIACEALVRWNHPELGWVSPADFIPLAEEIGEIDVIGTWVLENACKEACGWPETVGVSVNVSACQFTKVDIAETVENALRKSGLPPMRLQLEVTETALLSCPDRAIDALSRLKKLGVKIAMDDFGTGFSSLHYILQLPLSKIKIDKSFIDGISDKTKSVAIVEAIVQLAQRLELKVTAEGVETAGQEQALSEVGCHELQGYLFSKPVDKVAIFEEVWAGEKCYAAA